jgi:hypothetical protein
MHRANSGTGFSSTGFSLCSFDFRLSQIKTTQAEACATKTCSENWLFPQTVHGNWPFKHSGQDLNGVPGWG